MHGDPDDRAIVALYIERGARKYQAILPGPALVYFAASLVEAFPSKTGAGILDMLRLAGAPRREPPPARAAEPPRLDEEQERMLSSLGMTPEAVREVRAFFADDLDRTAARADWEIDRLMAELDEATYDVFVDADQRAGVLVCWHTLPGGADREACDRSLTRWVDLAFARLMADLMVELAKPRDLSACTSYVHAVRAFHGASGRLLPGDRAIFATHLRDDRGFVEVAAERKVTSDEERARYEGLLERLAAGLDEETREPPVPMTLSEAQEELTWLAGWVGRPGKRAVH